MKTSCGYCNKELERNDRGQINSFCDKECKGKWQTLQREKLGFTKEWLEDQYLKQGKGIYEIGREAGRDPKRVWEWLHDYGIKTRSRGSDVRQQFKKGQISAFKGRKHSQENKDKQRERRLKDGHVPYLKNGVHHLKGKKGDETPNWRGGCTPERQSLYSSVEWVESVKEVWKRDNAICQRCGCNHNTEELRGNFHIHHIESFMNREKRIEVDNLILLCRKCHLWIHSRKNINKDFLK